MSYATQALNSFHKKENFRCGNQMLDNYLHVQAKQDAKRMLSACFVLEENNIVQGYYTLSSAAIKRDLLPDAIIRKLPSSYHDLPAILLGRLAVDNSYKGQGLGKILLIDALKRSYDISLYNIGSMAVIVDPIDEDAKNFYTKYGFFSLLDSSKMFIAMKTVAQLFE